MFERYRNLYISRFLQGRNGFTKKNMKQSIRNRKQNKFAYLNYRSIVVREHRRDRAVR